MKTWKTKTVDGQKGIVLHPVDEELYELPSSAFGAVVEHDKDDRVLKVELPEERFVPFNKPGARVGAKRLYTVKGMKADGTLIQIPLEDQINNNVASPADAVGLRGYVRRGIDVFYDFDTGEGAYCPTWDCWAEWNGKLDGFCTDAHREITKGAEGSGPFGQGATTSRNWG